MCRSQAESSFHLRFKFVTFRGAKIGPTDFILSDWPLGLGCGRLAWDELVCAIPGDTSKDSAGAPSAFRRRLAHCSDQRDTMGRAETERDHRFAKRSTQFH